MTSRDAVGALRPSSATLPAPEHHPDTESRREAPPASSSPAGEAESVERVAAYRAEDTPLPAPRPAAEVSPPVPRPRPARVPLPRPRPDAAAPGPVRATRQALGAMRARLEALSAGAEAGSYRATLGQALAQVDALDAALEAGTEAASLASEVSALQRTLASHERSAQAFLDSVGTPGGFGPVLTGFVRAWRAQDPQLSDASSQVPLSFSDLHGPEPAGHPVDTFLTQVVLNQQLARSSPAEPPPSAPAILVRGHALRTLAEVDTVLSRFDPNTDEVELGRRVVEELDDALREGVELPPSVYAEINEEIRAWGTLDEDGFRGRINEVLSQLNVDLGRLELDPLGPDRPTLRFDDLAEGVGDTSRAAARALLFESPGDLGGALRSYSDGVGDFSRGMRTAATLLPDGIPFTLDFDVALPIGDDSAVFIPAGQTIRRDGDTLTTRSPGALVAIDGQLIAVDTLTAELGPETDELNATSLAAFLGEERFAVTGLSSSTGENAATLRAESVLVSGDGNTVAFDNFRLGTLGEGAQLGIDRAAVQTGDDSFLGRDLRVTQAPDGEGGFIERGSAQAVSTSVADFGLIAPSVTFERRDGAFRGSATGTSERPVYYRVGNDTELLTERVDLDLRESVGEGGTRRTELSLSNFGATRGSVGGTPITASDGVSLSSTLEDDELVQFGLVAPGSFTIDLSEGDGPSQNEPFVTLVGGEALFDVEDGQVVSARIRGDRVRGDLGTNAAGESEYVQLANGAVSFLATDEGMEVYALRGDDGEPSPFELRLDGIDARAANTRELALTRDAETGWWTGFEGNLDGLELTSTESSDVSPFRLDSEGNVNFSLSADPQTGVPSELRVGANDFRFIDARDPADATWFVSGNGNGRQDIVGDVVAESLPNGETVVSSVRAAGDEFNISNRPPSGTALNLRLAEGNELELVRHFDAAGALERTTFEGEHGLVDFFTGPRRSESDQRGLFNLVRYQGSLYPDGSLERFEASAQDGSFLVDGYAGTFSDDAVVSLTSRAPGEIARFESQVGALSIDDGSVRGSGVDLSFGCTFAEVGESCLLGGERGEVAGELGPFDRIGLRDRFLGTYVRDADGGSLLTFSGGAPVLDGVLDEHPFRLSFDGMTPEERFNLQLGFQDGEARFFEADLGPFRLDALEHDGVPALTFSAADADLGGELDSVHGPGRLYANFFGGTLDFSQHDDVEGVREVRGSFAELAAVSELARTSFYFRDLQAAGLVEIDDEFREAGIDLDEALVVFDHDADTILADFQDVNARVEGLYGIELVVPGETLDDAAVQTRLVQEEREDGTMAFRRFEVTMPDGARLDLDLEGLLLGLRADRAALLRDEDGAYGLEADAARVEAEIDGRPGALFFERADVRFSSAGIFTHELAGAHGHLEMDGFVHRVNLERADIQGLWTYLGTLDERIAGQRLLAAEIGLVPGEEGPSSVTLEMNATTDLGRVALRVHNANHLLGTAFATVNHAGVRIDAPAGEGGEGSGTIEVSVLDGHVTFESRDELALEARFLPTNVVAYEAHRQDMERAIRSAPPGPIASADGVIGFKFGRVTERRNDTDWHVGVAAQVNPRTAGPVMGGQWSMPPGAWGPRGDPHYVPLDWNFGELQGAQVFAGFERGSGLFRGVEASLGLSPAASIMAEANRGARVSIFGFSLGTNRLSAPASVSGELELKTASPLSSEGTLGFGVHGAYSLAPLLNHELIRDDHPVLTGFSFAVEEPNWRVELGRTSGAGTLYSVDAEYRLLDFGRNHRGQLSVFASGHYAQDVPDRFGGEALSDSVVGFFGLRADF